MSVHCKAGVALFVVLASALSGCGEELEQQAVSIEEGLVSLVARTFGDQVEPFEEVARVNGSPISVLDLALCLESEPVLGVRGCLMALIDAILVSEHALEQHALDPRVGDARLAALASVTMRELIEGTIEPASISQSALDEFMNDEFNRLYFSGPEVRVCSHLLVEPGENPMESAEQLPERIFNATDWSAVGREDHLRELQTTFGPEAEAVGVRIRVESHLVFQPPLSADEPPWPMIRRAVEEFSRALFALETPGDVSAPVSTRFGVHFILLEHIYPAATLDAETSRRVAVDELVQRQRAGALNDLLAQLGRAAEIRWFEENLRILHQSQDQIALEQRLELRDAVQQY